MGRLDRQSAKLTGARWPAGCIARGRLLGPSSTLNLEEPVKSHVWPMILLVSSAAACAPSAPPAAPAPRAAQSDAVPPILALLSERERLSLTSSQVIALESIARDWDAANARMNRRANLVRARRPELGFVALRPGASPYRAANNRRAAEAVERVLTPTQRQAACEPQHRSAAPAGASRAAPRAPKRPSWPWCATAITAQPLAAVQSGG